MIRFTWNVVNRLGTAALAVLVGSQAWNALAPAKAPVNAERREVAEDVVPQMVEDLRAARGDQRSAALLLLENDSTQFITERLRAAIADAGILSLTSPTVMERVRGSLKLTPTAFGDLESAVARGRELDAATVIFGTVHDFESSAEGARISVTLRLADVPSGTLLLDRRYERDTLPATDAGDEEETAAPERSVGDVLRRLAGWLLAVLLLPVFTISFLRAMVRKQSNWLNGVTLGIYTTAGGLLAFLAIDRVVAGWALLALIGATAFAFAYNVFIMTYAVRLEAD